MANPFLFGADPMQQPAQAGTGMADNPFLSNQQAMASPSPMVANPFMAAAPPPPQQMNYYQQQPQMEAAAAANPFASFAAAAAPPQMSNNSPFGQPSWQQQQQQQQQHQPHQQQLQGQFGQYTQVMAESSSQPQSTTSHNLQTSSPRQTIEKLNIDQ